MGAAVLRGASSALSRDRVLPLVAAVIAATIVGSGVFALEAAEEARHLEEVRSSVIREASRLRADLERAVDSRIARTEGLVGFATAQAARGAIDEELFRQFAVQIEESTTTPLRSLQLAPNGVVTYIYPLEGNEQALGHDLMADPDRRAAVEATIAARRTMVAGPFELLQGGTAIVARAPVFVDGQDGSEQWWGLATIVADIDPIYDEAGLTAMGDDVVVALRGRDGRGADGDLFYGSPDVFDGDPITSEVTLPNGAWELAILPAGGWDSVAWPGRTTTLGLGALLAVLVGGLVARVLASRAAVDRALADRAELISTANAPIVQVMASGEVVVWNPAAERVSGQSSGGMVGSSLHGPELQPGTLAAAMAVLLDETIRTGERLEGHEAVVRHTDGRRVTLVFNTSPVVDRGGKVGGVIAVGQDVSARVDAERIRREAEAVAEASRLKDEFLASMSHELRTPLNGIIGLTSLLQHGTAGALNDQQAEYVGHVHDAGQHLLALINDVLDLAKLEAGGDDVTLEPTDVAAAVEAAVAVVRPLAESEDLEFTLRVADDLPTVRGEERRLVQVLLNLLANAVKFTSAGGRIEVVAEQRGGDVRLSVSDTGIGIPEDKRNLLFRPFTQIDASLDRAYEGSGLGLALSHSLVKRFGGRIEVESEPGVGSTFTVILPAMTTVGERPTSADVVVQTPPAPATPRADEAAPSPEASSRTVLVVEDNEVNRMILTAYLERQGYGLLEATNGREAVELARAERPDAVLMDIQMPEMDGLQATRILKADPETWSIPVVALTALAMEGDEARCLDAGCDAYLPKPVNLSDVAAILDGLGQVGVARGRGPR